MGPVSRYALPLPSTPDRATCSSISHTSPQVSLRLSNLLMCIDPSLPLLLPGTPNGKSRGYDRRGQAKAQDNQQQFNECKTCLQTSELMFVLHKDPPYEKLLLSFT